MINMVSLEETQAQRFDRNNLQTFVNFRQKLTWTIFTKIGSKNYEFDQTSQRQKSWTRFCVISEVRAAQMCATLVKLQYPRKNYLLLHIGFDTAENEPSKVRVTDNV